MGLEERTIERRNLTVSELQEILFDGRVTEGLAHAALHYLIQNEPEKGYKYTKLVNKIKDLKIVSLR